MGLSNTALGLWFPFLAPSIALAEYAGDTVKAAISGAADEKSPNGPGILDPIVDPLASAANSLGKGVEGAAKKIGDDLDKLNTGLSTILTTVEVLAVTTVIVAGVVGAVYVSKNAKAILKGK